MWICFSWSRNTDNTFHSLPNERRKTVWLFNEPLRNHELAIPSSKTLDSTKFNCNRKQRISKFFEKLTLLRGWGRKFEVTLMFKRHAWLQKEQLVWGLGARRTLKTRRSIEKEQKKRDQKLNSTIVKGLLVILSWKRWFILLSPFPGNWRWRNC